MKKGVSWLYSKECTEAFLALKDVVTSAHVLQFSNFDSSIEVRTNALIMLSLAFESHKPKNYEHYYFLEGLPFEIILYHDGEQHGKKIYEDSKEVILKIGSMARVLSLI